MTKKTYTFSECYHVLNVDPKTFRRWLDRANIAPTVSKADSRVKFLTEEQVQFLAQEHDRALHEATQAFDHVPYGMYKLLTDRVIDLEQELIDTRDLVGKLAQRLSELEEQIPPARTSKAKIGPLPPGLVNLYTFINEHRVPQNEVRRLIKAGFIHPVNGKWDSDKGRIEEALDQAGQYEFWAQLHTRSDFCTCDLCPHSKNEQS